MSGPRRPVSVASSPPSLLLRVGVEERRAMLARMAGAGLDGVLYSDHVSFRGGAGMDGLLLMAGLSQLHPTLEVHVGVYLLPLRHPVLVARQLSTVAELAPGRLHFGVGVGGEDRHEIEVCGVDPATRGRRCDESLAVLRRLLTGETVTHTGEFFTFDACRILPAPDPPVPILVGGRSDAAVRRAGRAGEGWLGTWCSVRRYREAIALCAEEAAAVDRQEVAWRHGLQLWVGLDADRSAARDHVAAGMAEFYRLPFEAFERYTPYGTPAEVAEALAAYVGEGATQINLTPCASSAEAAIELAGEVAAELRRIVG